MPTTEKQRCALIVEDDEELSLLFAEILSDGEFEAYIERDGAMAFDQIVSLRPDVIILDIHLPHVSGLDILKQVRADDRVKDSRVIVITANAHLAQQAEKDADIVFLKPVSYEQLASISERLL